MAFLVDLPLPRTCMCESDPNADRKWGTGRVVHAPREWLPCSIGNRKMHRSARPERRRHCAITRTECLSALSPITNAKHYEGPSSRTTLPTAVINFTSPSSSRTTLVFQTSGRGAPRVTWFCHPGCVVVALMLAWCPPLLTLPAARLCSPPESKVHGIRTNNSRHISADGSNHRSRTQAQS